MSGIRSIYRGPVQKGYATAGSAPLRVDDTTNDIRVNVSGSGTTEKTLSYAEGRAPVDVTSATLAVTLAAHAGRFILLDRAGGITATLPAAIGSGATYNFIVQTTFTSNGVIQVANASDYMYGLAWLQADGGATVVGFATANTGTPSTESDTITMTGSDKSTGGIKGGFIRCVDVQTNVWFVEVFSDAAGTEATPFSAAV